MTDYKQFYDCDHPGCGIARCNRIDYRAIERKREEEKKAEEMAERVRILEIREENVRLKAEIVKLKIRLADNRTYVKRVEAILEDDNDS